MTRVTDTMWTVNFLEQAVSLKAPKLSSSFWSSRPGWRQYMIPVNTL